MTAADEAMQQRVERHFDHESGFWRDVYTQDSVLGTIFRERQARAVRWAVAYGAGRRALDVGCGAGTLSVELAEHGFSVDAIDSSDAMVAAARASIDRTGTSRLVSAAKGDVQALAFADASFDVVLALGVLPWLERPERAVVEIARVLKPGGHVIFSCDNALALQLVVDPRLWPLWDPVKRAAKARWQRPERPRSFTRRSVFRLLGAARLEFVAHGTFQFGPFSFLGVPLLPDAASQRLHTSLQTRADRGELALRSLGRQHLVLARAVQVMHSA